MVKLTPPTTHEYASFYGDYIQRATQRENVFSTLSEQIDEMHTALDALTEAQSCFKPGPVEWSIKEVVGHLIDGERVFSYRLLRISRGDTKPLTGFEQEDYVRAAGFDGYALSDLVNEFEYLRRANIIAIAHMSEEAIHRHGTASGMTVSARALIYMMVGHVEHHMASLQEKYLPEARTM